MRKILILITLLSSMLLMLLSCTPNQNIDENKPNEIPQNSITYTDFTFGNVVQDGKQALFFNFTSEYTVNSMEIAGTLLDKEENSIHSFDTSLTFGTPSYNPEFAIRVESGLVQYIKSVSFTKIKAYTLEKIDLTTEGKDIILKHISTINESTIKSIFASGSSITTTTEKITINLDDSENDCGFRWDLSEANLKSDTQYLVLFENLSFLGIQNTSVQLNTTWIDSTYPLPQYYHHKGNRFDIITEGQISSDYYQFFKSKTYDIYTFKFVLNHGVENSKTKSMHFSFWGVEGQLSFEKLSIYEITRE